MNNKHNNCCKVVLHGGISPKPRMQKDETNSSYYKQQSRGDNLEYVLTNVANQAIDHARNGADAVDVVETTLVTMEDSSLFNAGLGSCLTDSKNMELDAGIMDGGDLQCGAVGMITNFQNPSRIARIVMERYKHSLIVGTSAEDIAKQHGMTPTPLVPSKKALEKYANLKGCSFNEKTGTIGIVALDKRGNLASGVSTGGLWLKTSGRIGDSAVVTSGFFANNRIAAAAATGDGDNIMKSAPCKYVCDLLELGEEETIQGACEKAVARIKSKSDDGGLCGIIGIDRRGNLGVAWNFGHLVYAYNSEDMGKPYVFC